MTTEDRAKRAAEIRNVLPHFTGTENWYRHSLVRNVLYSDGVKYLCEKAECYWLLDKIATLQMEPKIKSEPFQVWRLKVSHPVGDAVLTCDDGGKSPNDGVHEIVHSEHITFTDFPLDDIELWVEVGEQPVILLPSEH